MTEEEYFRKTYPDYCYGNRLLSPYWDLFQDGVEFGERQSEQKIEELENKKAGLEERCEISQDEVSRLIQENTELKKINSETLAQLNLDNGELIIENEKLRKENAELKEANKTLATMKNDMWVELEKKRAESQGITNKLHQLTKAKEIIKELMSFSVQLCDSRHTVDFEKTREQAEQFLKENGGKK